MSFFTWNRLFPQIQQKYEKSITRNADTPEEASALAAAEGVNYSAITGFNRFEGSTDPEAYLHPSTYLTYTNANFVDSEVLNYYQTRYDSLQGTGNPKGITLTYQANVTKLLQLRVYNTPGGNMIRQNKTIPWDNITVVFADPITSMPFLTGSFMGYSSRMFYANQSGPQQMKPGFDLNFSDCYLVEMKLDYSEYYAPLAAMDSSVFQVVVLNRSLEPILLGLDMLHAVS